MYGHPNEVYKSQPQVFVDNDFLNCLQNQFIFLWTFKLALRARFNILLLSCKIVPFFLANHSLFIHHYNDIKAFIMFGPTPLYISKFFVVAFYQSKLYVILYFVYFNLLISMI